jgi:YlmC/YmxH family sporulation protein
MGLELTFCNIREREVVNIADGRKLGRVCDIVLSRKGAVCGFVVPCERRLFRGGENLFIPWESICRIGDDVILVELCGREVCNC